MMVAGMLFVHQLAAHEGLEEARLVAFALEADLLGPTLAPEPLALCSGPPILGSAEYGCKSCCPETLC